MSGIITATDVIAANNNEPVLKDFNFGNLPEGFEKKVTWEFNKLAVNLTTMITTSPEKTEMLVKLLALKNETLNLKER